jgi:putative SOS response-associated peptidase YedK
MCGRYSNAKDLAELMKLVDAVMRVAFFGPRYNIAPTQMAAYIPRQPGLRSACVLVPSR